MTDRRNDRRWALEMLLGGVGALALAGCAGGGRRSPTVGTSGDAVALPTDRSDQPMVDPTGSAVRSETSGELTDRRDRTTRLLDEWNHRRSSQTRMTDAALPGVIGRRTWTLASPILARADAMGSITRITVHHDGMNPYTSRSQRDAMRRIDAIRRSHVAKGWADIGYHFVIDPSGRVYEARPIVLQGAHVKYNNPHNLGIVLLGNFMEQQPTDEALVTLDAFLAGAMRRYRVPVARVVTHRELRPTACPGTALQQHMVQARSLRGTLARV